MRRISNGTTAGGEMNERTGRDRHSIGSRQSSGGWLRCLALLLIAIHVTACSKQSDLPKQPAKPPEPKNQTYRMIGGQSVISFVSSDELEIREGGQNIVCKYTKQDGRLRVVVNAMGTTTAKYFNMTPQGLVDEDGDIYYEPATFEKITAQIELNSQLWAAVERDDSAVIGDLISKGAAVETRDGRRTALVMAIEEGKTNAVAALLKHRANPNQRVGDNGTTARNMVASLGGGWVGERRTREHDVITAMLLKSTGDLPAPQLARIEAPFTILAVQLSASRDCGLMLRTVGDRPVGKATIAIGDYVFEKDDVTPNPEHYIIGYGYCLADSDNPYNVQARFELLEEAVGSASNIPVVITLNSAGGHKDEVYFTIPTLGSRNLFLRSPWNSLEPAGSSVAQLFDDIPKDVAERRAQREALCEQYSANIVGTWVDQDGDRYEYKADGTKIERLRNGRQSSEKWTIKGDTLDCGSWQGKILSLDASQYSMKLPNGRIWKGTRVTQSVLDAEREKVEKTRQMLVGTWRDDQDSEFTINADGSVRGEVLSGKWSLQDDIVVSGSGKRYRIVSSDATSFVFEALDSIFGGEWRWSRVR